MTLREFIDSKFRNIWLEAGDLRVYVRKSKRLIDDLYVDALDIASVEVLSCSRGKGVFTKFLDECEALEMPLYIENVMDGRFRKFFVSRGYRSLEQRSGHISESFIRMSP